jgi:hypothetical protein
MSTSDTSRKLAQATDHPDEEGRTVFGAETDPEVDPEVPKVGVKPGWKTSQGQLTGAFFVVGMAIAAALGLKVTVGDVRGYAETAAYLVGLVGTLLAVWRQLQAYTNSRGKIQSNAIWANASLQSPLVRNSNLDPDMLAQALKEYKTLAGVSVKDLLAAAEKDPALRDALDRLGGPEG